MWILLVSLCVGLPDRSPEARALAYLSGEVPGWSRGNQCFSCHNNADGARALYLAPPGSVDRKAALADSTTWLSSPSKWEHNGGEGPFSDKRLARIQFAAALVDAIKVGAVRDRTPLTKSAETIVADQASDGSWAPDGPDAIGSPATLGRPLATYTAREVLKAADPKKFERSIRQADAWLSRLEPRTTLDAAVILLSGLKVDSRAKALALIEKGQSDDGGWGPFADAPPEPFDTALVLIALRSLPDKHEEAIKKGRAYLIKIQREDGSWTETTRPSGNESYAQRVSTAGWATRALLLTAPKAGSARTHD